METAEGTETVKDTIFLARGSFLARDLLSVSPPAASSVLSTAEV